MNERVPPDRYPWWVKFSLLGARSRRSQWFWVGASLLATAILIVIAADESSPVVRFIYSVAAAWGVAAAALYYFTIRWMDQHGTWPG